MGNKRKNRRLRLLKAANERQADMFQRNAVGQFVKQADSEPKTKIVKAAEPAIDPAMLRTIRDAMIDVDFADRIEFNKAVNYGLAKDGIYLMKSSNIGEVHVKLGSISPDLPNAPKMIEDFIFALPKMPWAVFAPAIKFLKAVKDTLQTEGLVRFYYSETRGWYAYVPTQVVSVASVNVSGDEPDQEGIFAIEIHSHPGGSSSFSGIDDAHEQIDRVFLCVAWQDNATPNFHARVGTGLKKWLDISLLDVIEMEAPLQIQVSPLMLIGQKGDFFPYFDFPQEWMQKVSKERGSYTSYGGGHYNGAYRTQGHNGHGYQTHDRRRVIAPVVSQADWIARKQEREKEQGDSDAKVAQWLKERHENGDLLDSDIGAAMQLADEMMHH
jgi:hypothetical protein